MRKLWHSLIRGLGLNNGPRNGFHFCDLASDGQVVHSFALFTTLSLYSNLPGLPPRVTLPEKSVHYKEQQGRNFSDYIIF